MDTCEEFLPHTLAVVILTKLLFSPFLSTPSSLPLLPTSFPYFFQKVWKLELIYICVCVCMYVYIKLTSNLFRMMGNVNKQSNQYGKVLQGREGSCDSYKPPPRHLCPHQRQSPEPAGLGMMVLESLSVTHYFHSSQRPFSLLGLCWSIMVQQPLTLS